jgi:hypothetical protein
MFYSFKPGRCRTSSASASQKAAWHLYRRMLLTQRRYAQLLSLQASKLSPMSLISISASLLLTALVSCTWLLLNGLSGPGTGLPDLVPDAISVPKLPSEPNKAVLGRYLDSLQGALTRNRIENNLQNP